MNRLCLLLKRSFSKQSETIRAACVSISVKPQHRNDFLHATLANASASVQENGNLRFDVLQQTSDENQFTLYEVWKDEKAMNAHKETEHYTKWKNAVASWMQKPRVGVQHTVHFPYTFTQWQTIKKVCDESEEEKKEAMKKAFTLKNARDLMDI
eukprot:TRINITY_DN2820_c0_g1_i1.p1 TRINITY_DN2820_c0_g1~~TRINITY_DN2820_c0_g1_i1.p1  ORF type:complete len:154 (+),score=36.50 TRINITY_DN2820_c0_g1_i1:52-513(+)